MEGLWDEWERLTRFLESSRVVFARERVMWESLNLKDFDGARIATKRDHVEYDVDLDDHLEALEDEELLWGAVLVHSFGLAQAAVGERIALDMRQSSGIEDWGRRFLAANGKEWKNVKDGKGGAVEVAVVRNAVAHGARSLSPDAAKRLRKAKAKVNWVAGSKLRPTYSNLRCYRARLESLLRAGGLG